MKRKFLLIASIALMASCAKDGATTDVASAVVGIDTDEINFLTNTTRATTTLLSNLEGDAAGFVVYSTIMDGNSNKVWSLDGTNNYVNANSGVWKWTDATANETKWPTDATSYPVDFYAVYYPSATGVTLPASTDLNSANVGSVDMGLVISAPNTQQDILSATGTAITKPSDGKLSLVFDHVLSKVDFGFFIGQDKKVYVNSMVFANLDDEATYGVEDESWNGNNDDYSAVYPLTDFSAIDNLEGTATTETTATSITTMGTTPASLMLLPQSTTPWDITSWVALNQYTTPATKNIQDPTDTYLQLLYRATDDSAVDGTFVDYIGFADASDHPDFATLGTANLNGKPLFVKVGYPVGTTWESGKNYTYNIKIGTADASNGYLLDDVYYDENGDPTKLPIIPGKEIGDPVSSGNIDFEITVGEWDPVTAETLN